MIDNCKICGRSIHVCDCHKDSPEKSKQTIGKRRYSLLQWKAIEGIIDIREYGSIKYSDPKSWRNVEPQKYIDAAMRHLVEMQKGKEKDAESGLYHADHVACNMMFVSQLIRERDRIN